MIYAFADTPWKIYEDYNDDCIFLGDNFEPKVIITDFLVKLYFPIPSYYNFLIKLLFSLYDLEKFIS